MLTAPGSLTGNLKLSTAPRMHASSDDGVSAAVKAGIKFLAAHIEDALKMPVINETNLQGEYDWDVIYDGKNPTSIIEALRKDCGLELKRKPTHGRDVSGRSELKSVPRAGRERGLSRLLPEPRSRPLNGIKLTAEDAENAERWAHLRRLFSRVSRIPRFSHLSVASLT